MLYQESSQTFELCSIVGDDHPPLVHILRQHRVTFVRLWHSKRELATIGELLLLLPVRGREQDTISREMKKGRRKRRRKTEEEEEAEEGEEEE
jgi:hypothetical protein